MISTQNLTFQYPKGTKFLFPDLQVAKKEQWLLMGESGCGKTTLLHLLSGILKPESGNISIDGQSIENLKEHQLDLFRARNIGMIFQRNYFLQALSMQKNLEMAIQLAKNSVDKEKITPLLERLNVLPLASNKPSELSQGELQRFSIARALINSPQLILADEPTSNLDDNNANDFINLLLKISKETGTTLLIATHDSRLKNHIDNILNLSR